jgi:hypothetical protein
LDLICLGSRLAKQDDFFYSILPTFELSSIFVSSYGNIENWLEPKTEPTSEK